MVHYGSVSVRCNNLPPSSDVISQQINTGSSRTYTKEQIYLTVYCTNVDMNCAVICYDTITLSGFDTENKHTQKRHNKPDGHYFHFVLFSTRVVMSTSRNTSTDHGGFAFPWIEGTSTQQDRSTQCSHREMQYN